MHRWVFGRWLFFLGLLSAMCDLLLSIIHDTSMKAQKRLRVDIGGQGQCCFMRYNYIESLVWP